MTEKSAAELEREAEAARARVMETAESIRGKMTPGQLLDEFTGLFSGGESSAMLSNLRTQVRDNPLPVTMVGAGLAWLMFGSGTSNTAHGSAGYPLPSAPGRHDEGERGGFGGTLSDAASSLSSAATSVSGTVSSAVSNAAEGLTGSTATARSVTGDMAAKTARSAQELFENQPLAVAAAGLAIGAAIGAMLPHTATEDEQLGAYGDKLRNTAGTMLDRGLDEAKQVAADAYETIKQEAGRQHMEAGTMADQLGEVVKSTADKTEHAVRDRISDSSQRQT
ncbi:MAG: DUF3618 domain-containing protein [Mesorhizobium sp.]|uniref:DUF3618 domain-containing protein n=1 Tax=unclassified Mesorhizobium TaxID=325217 RepID=UPI000FD44DE5|nr:MULTISPECIES: DUF3618 domain-containing protein [unclassified Mesorhizobium]RUU89183.1 DUF3618 domain-containing protein [Mesorhizobium sp. M7A.F.Ca.MR.176.00.0.0]RVD17714.1 DUF3618 domain-containing protein [Mesorhizobium sp. M7A.F.Ca.ET.027.02.1.1]RWD09195.1 MAG: DUF3618 domain-containing protein [Mesorhizobium sp.]